MSHLQRFANHASNIITALLRKQIQTALLGVTLSEFMRHWKKRILEQLCNSSPSTLQVVVALSITAVIHFKALVTRSSPKSLYLTDNMNVARFIHSSPFSGDEWNISANHSISNQYTCNGDEWVTSESKWITATTFWRITSYNATGDELQSCSKFLGSASI